jgi:chromosome segregation ATPase
MSETNQKTVTREEFNRELVRALDDLVRDAKYHEELILESIARTEELSRRRRAEEAMRAQAVAIDSVARETSPPYGDVSGRLNGIDGRLDRVEGRLDGIDGRLDRVDGRLDRVDGRLDRIDGRLDGIERTLADIRERMATKVELENTNENVKKMADGYVTVGQRLDAVAELLKVRVILP